MTREAVTEDSIDAPDVAIPWRFAANAVVYVGEELLVPANGREKLRRDFVFRLEIIRERVRVADVRNLKACEKNLAPKLPMPPLVAEVLGEGDLIVIPNAFASGKSRALFCNRKEISALLFPLAK